MIILKRLVFLLALLVVGLLFLPTMLFAGEKGLDKLTEAVDPIAEWAGFSL